MISNFSKCVVLLFEH